MKVTKSVRDLYDSINEVACILKNEINELIVDFCKSKNWSSNSRIKEIHSFAQKLETGQFESLESIDDFLGYEIIVTNVHEIATAKDYIKDNFDVIHERPNKTKLASDFSFDSIRMYVRAKPSLKEKIYKSMVFEIQIKTLLEKAWSSATHDFTYKCENAEWAKERLVYQIKAILTHADLMLAEMERISQLDLLKKEYTKYDQINAISLWIRTSWDLTERPSNMKRLAEVVDKLCQNYNVKFDELKDIVNQHKLQNGGSKDLSIYATILQALFDTNHAEFIKKAKSKYKDNKELKLIIPEEVDIEQNIKNSLHKARCIFINDIESSVHHKSHDTN